MLTSYSDSLHNKIILNQKLEQDSFSLLLGSGFIV